VKKNCLNLKRLFFNWISLFNEIVITLLHQCRKSIVAIFHFFSFRCVIMQFTRVINCIAFTFYTYNKQKLCSWRKCATIAGVLCGLSAFCLHNILNKIILPNFADVCDHLSKLMPTINWVYFMPTEFCAMKLFDHVDIWFHEFFELPLWMLTRLTRLETGENFSVSRIVFLAIENFRLLARMSSLRLFNDGRYVKTPAGSLQASLSREPE